MLVKLFWRESPNKGTEGILKGYSFQESGGVGAGF